MQFRPFVFSLLVSAALAQSVPEGIAPDEAAPEGCEETYDGVFTLGKVQIGEAQKRDTAQVCLHRAFNPIIAC